MILPVGGPCSLSSPPNDRRPQDGDCFPFSMQLAALLLVVLIVGVLASRIGGRSWLTPLPPASPRPSETLQRVEKSVEAAGQKDQERLDDAMKALR